MTLPNISFTKSNTGGSNLTPGSSKALVIGPCYNGTATKSSEIYTFGSPADLYSTLGYGNAAFEAGLILASAPAGYSNVDVIVSEASIAPEVTTVTSSDISIEDVPSARYDMDVRINITTAGGRGVGKFTFTTDGTTLSAPTRIPTDGQFTIPNSGVSASFGAVTHTVGDKKLHARIKGPRMTTTDLASCITSLSNSNDNYTVIAIADSNEDPVSSSALFTAMDGHLTTLQSTYKKYTQAIMNGGGEAYYFNVSNATAANTTTAASVDSVIGDDVSTNGNFIMLTAEKWNTYLPVPFVGHSQPRLPLSFKAAALAHAAGDDVSKPIDYGSVPGVATPSYDERARGEVYNLSNVVAPYTAIGQSGIKLNNSWLKGPDGTAWLYWEQGRVTNRAIEICKNALQSWLKYNISTQSGTGYITAAAKSDIEDAVNAQLIAALGDPIDSFGNKGYVNIDDDGTPGIAWTIRGDTDVATSKILYSTLQIIPKTKINQIAVTVALADAIG